MKSIHQLWEETSLTDRIIAFFTVVLAAVGILELLVYRAQLKINRIDERAWQGIVAYQVKIAGNDTAGYTVGFPIMLFNNGKTPALKIYAEFATDVLEAGQSSTFNYTRNMYTDEIGILVPTQTDAITVPLMHAVQSGGRTLSAAELQELKDGKAYLVIYGKSSYSDVFGVRHWVHFCNWQQLSQVGTFHARTCTEYNDVDHN